MKFLREIRNSDVFEGTSDITDSFSWTRESVRIIIFDESDNVAILHSKKRDYGTLPGGGIEKGETSFDAAIREAKEETGCDIYDLKEVGYIMSYNHKPDRAEKTFCYHGHLQGEKEPPNFTPDELVEEYEVLWLPLQDVIRRFEEQRPGFIRIRNLAFLRALD